jgi:hypothetical protein
VDGECRLTDTLSGLQYILILPPFIISGFRDGSAVLSSRPVMLLMDELGVASNGIASVDLSLAYNINSSGSVLWAPAHQQWCALLCFSATLIRTLGQHANVSHFAFSLYIVIYYYI